MKNRDMREKAMIDLHGQISLAFLKKSRFTGSYQGMRYLLQKQEREAEAAHDEKPAKLQAVLEAVIWPEPYSFEATEPDKKHGRDFAFSGDGLWEAVDWLNQEYEAGYNRQRAGGVRQ